MKTFNKFSAVLMTCLMVVLSGFVFTACNDDDDVDTNQFTGGVKLNVFGPSPVARGGELRFIGSGMNQIQGVTIPGCDEIVDIKVVSPEEIRVTVPQTAEPGLVTLRYANGKITTKTLLTYTEPISIEDFSPKTVKAGQELTVSGEYLNLINEVIFNDNVVIAAEDFVSQSRSEIKVVVPAEAQSGKFIISDGAEIPNWIYSDEELDVVLPSVEKVLDLTDAKPGDVINVAGKNLDLVVKVVMPNEDEIDFTVDGDKLTFTLPENATDGAISMVPASGVKVAVATIGMAEPQNLVATPADEIRSGDKIVISGTNLEVVSSINFPGVADAVDFTLNGDKIETAMPAAAITGDIVLNLLSGKKVSVAIATAKPGDIAYAVTSVPVGDPLTVNGKNMDVVDHILFEGGSKAVPTSATRNSLVVTVPTTALAGKLTFVMANGEQVEGPSIEMEFPSCAWLPVVPERLVKGTIVEIPMNNGDKLTDVILNGEKAQFINEMSRGLLILSVPQQLEGTYELKLVSSNGEISYNVNIFPPEVIAYEGPCMLTWGDDGRFGIDMKFFKDAKAGTRIKIYLRQTEKWGQFQFNNGSWNNDNIFFPEVEGAYLKTDHLTSKDITEFTLTLNQSTLDNILGAPGDYFGLNTEYNLTGQVGMVIQGSDMWVDKIVFIY